MTTNTVRIRGGGLALDTFGRSIGILARRLNVFLNHELVGCGISARELMYLGALLECDGMTQDQLAGEFCIDKAAVARALQAMEEKGLVLRIEDSEDRRAKRVLATQKARDLRPFIEGVQRRWRTLCNPGCDDRELAQLERVLAAMAERVKQAADDCDGT